MHEIEVKYPGQVLCSQMQTYTTSSHHQINLSHSSPCSMKLKQSQSLNVICLQSVVTPDQGFST